MEKQKSNFVAVAALMLTMAAPALAADFVGGGGNDLWNNGANWSPAGVPTLASGGLNINANATVQTAANEIGGVMAINADLIINADLKYPAAQNNQDVTMGGTLTQNAGDVYFSDDMRIFNGAIHTMNGGTFVNRDYYRFDSPSPTDQTRLVITGGSFTIGNYLRINGGSGTVKVVGDTASLISLRSLETFSLGTLDIVLKDGGITTIDVTNTADLPGILNVTLDGGFMLPGIDTDYTLISAGSLSGTFNNINISVPNTDWSVNTAGSDLVLSYTASIIPEPGTMTLLAIGGLGLLLNRRRRRA